MSSLPLTLRSKREARWGWLFISPWLIGFVLFTFGPMIASAVLSFTRFDGRNMPEFIGIANYSKMLADGKMWNSLRVTFVYAIIAMPLTLVAGFMLAYLLNLKIPAMNFWRTIFYMPSMLSGVVVAMLWKGLFDNRYGIINYMLSLVGIQGPEWLMDPNYTLYCFVFLALWGVGGGVIIYLAGLQGIQSSYYEAAELDGCNRFQKLIHITIPHMTPIIFFNVVMGVIATFQFFAEPMVLTKGGPGDSTRFFNLFLYDHTFKYQEFGYGSALAWLLFFIVLVLTLLIIRSSSLWVFYEGEVKQK